jgi:PPP family 3-phenylpropionic acid transporter
VFCAVGALKALTLPGTPRPAVSPGEKRSRLPTGKAFRAIFGEPHALVFCLAMFLIHAASQTFYQFYPLHVTERSHIDKQWVGLIANIGVLAEVPFMLGFVWIVRKLTLRRVMYLGALAVGLRLVLLAVTDSAWVAVGVQLLHGPTVLLVHVAPPIFLNGLADDRYRNSIQGLYAMAFAGAGKVVSSWASGWAAERSLPWTFAGAAALCLLAMMMFYFAFAPGVKSGGEIRGSVD